VSVSLNDQAAAAERLSTAVAGLDPATQQKVLSAIVPPPTGAAVNKLWLILIVALAVALLTALVGGVVLVIDGKTSDVAVTAFSSLLAGLLGLFAPSPTTAN
jgi:hypothetical protein